MAIEISPKKEISKLIVGNVFLFLSALFFLVAAISYVVLLMFNNGLAKDLSDIEKLLSPNAEEMKLQEEVSDYQKKIKDFSSIVNNHQDVLNAIAEVEKFCHPKVQFSKFSLDAEKRIVGLSGLTDNFEILGQQIIILKKSEVVKNLDSSAIGFAGEEKVGFNFEITLAPEVFFKK